MAEKKVHRTDPSTAKMHQGSVVSVHETRLALARRGSVDDDENADDDEMQVEFYCQYDDAGAIEKKQRILTTERQGRRRGR